MCSFIEALSVVAFESGAIWALCHAAVVTLVKEPKTFRKSDICNGIQGEEIGPGAIIDGQVCRIRSDHALPQRCGTPPVECIDHSDRFVRDLMLPRL